MDNLNNINYADDWKKASEPVRYEKKEVQTPAESEKIKKKPKAAKPLLTLIQIVLCLLIVAAAYILKVFGGEFYNTVNTAYKNEINREIILNPYENDLDKLINASQD